MSRGTSYAGETEASGGVAVAGPAADRPAVLREFHADESEAWDMFVSAASNGHVLQSWAWGEFKRGYGWQPVRLALVQDGIILAAAQVLLRSVAGFSLAYVPRGPVVPNNSPRLYTIITSAIHRLARSRHSIFLKVEPNEPAGSEVRPLLEGMGFVRSPHSVQARATLMLDLTGGDEAVLARMKSKTRYNLRLAERRGVSVRIGAGEEDMQRFHDLMVETGRRDDFHVRSLGYYRDVLKEFRKRDQAELLLAEFKGTVVAGLMVFAYGAEGIYMYGASSNEHRREMPNHLLQWRAIQWCMEKGCSRYDFWGIPAQVVGRADAREELENKNFRSGLWGVYRFKQGFGGTPVRYVGAYDYAYIRPLYLLWAHVRKNREL